MKKYIEPIIRLVVTTILCVTASVFTYKYSNNIPFPDLQLLPFLHYGFNFDTTCIAGKVKSISVGGSYKGSFKKLTIKFDGPWYYYESPHWESNLVITNITKEVAMNWFESNKNHQWNYFTNNYKKHGSGWQNCGSGKLVDSWELTLITPPDVDIYNLQGKFIIHQFAALWKQKKMGEFGSEHAIYQTRLEVK